MVKLFLLQIKNLVSNYVNFVNYDVLTKDIPSLKTLTNYFKSIINILNILNLPIIGKHQLD